MTIYHVLDEAEPFSEHNGGAISRWASNTLRDGTEVVVCPSHDDSWKFPPERVFRLPMWAFTHKIHPFLYRVHWSVQRAVYSRIFMPLVRKMQPGDVMYMHNRVECAWIIAELAHKFGIHVVLHMHNSLILRSSRRQLKALKNTPIVFCSRFLKDEVEAAFPGHFTNTSVVYNGADGEKFTLKARPANDVPEIIFTGRLVPYKGIHILLEAMGLLEQRGVQARCKVVGGLGFGASGKSRYIEQLKRDCPPNAELVGYKSGDALAELLRKADIFCCPSIWNDPFPLAPLEGMASGLPIVASRTGGIPEALAYGGGILVPPDDPAALADALQRLVQDPTLRETLSAEARTAFQEHFLWQNVRDQYRAVIRKVLS